MLEKNNITTQSGPVILVVLWYSHWSSQGVNDARFETLRSDATKEIQMYITVCLYSFAHNLAIRRHHSGISMLLASVP